MAHTAHLYERLTNLYNNDWSQLDRHHYWGKAKLLAPKITDAGDGIDVTVYHKQRVVFERPVDRTTAADLLAEALHQGCRCEHDCCGHWFGGLNRLIRVGKREFVAFSSYSRNV